jgi:hypothetical protein
MAAQYRFLIWPIFEGHRGQSSKRHQYWHVSLLFDLEHSKLVWTCIWAPSTFLPNFGRIRLQIWPPGGHLKKQSELMAGSAPWHNTRGFLFDLLKVTEVKVQNVTISRHILLLFDLEYSNIMLIWINLLGTVYISTKFRPDRTSNIAARLSPCFRVMNGSLSTKFRRVMVLEPSPQSLVAAIEFPERFLSRQAIK